MKNIIIAMTLAAAALTAEARVYDIVDYGAVSDTTRLSTAAVQKAIDSCNAAGGGTVSVLSLIHI